MSQIATKVKKGAPEEGEWLSVAKYAKKHKIKNPEVLYLRMLRNQVKWREIDVVVKRKQIYDVS